MIEFAVEAKGKLMSRDNLRAINSPRISLLTPVRKEVRENQLWWHASFGMQRSQFTRKEMILQGRNMVYGLRAQSPKYDWDQGSE